MKMTNEKSIALIDYEGVQDNFTYDEKEFTMTYNDVLSGKFLTIVRDSDVEKSTVTGKLDDDLKSYRLGRELLVENSIANVVMGDRLLVNILIYNIQNKNIRLINFKRTPELFGANIHNLIMSSLKEIKKDNIMIDIMVVKPQVNYFSQLEYNIVIIECNIEKISTYPPGSVNLRMAKDAMLEGLDKIYQGEKELLR